MIPPLQVPWVRAEFDRHAEVLARHNLLWHFRASETPEHQSTARAMDDDLERYVLEKLANERKQQAERDRLLVLEQLRVARPTIERELAELRAAHNSAGPSDKIKKAMELAQHLYRLGGRRDAWITLLSEYNRFEKLVDVPLKLDVAMELAEMMFEDGAFDHAARLLHSLAGHEESLSGPTRFRFVRLLARGYLEHFADEPAMAGASTSS